MIHHAELLALAVTPNPLIGRTGQRRLGSMIAFRRTLICAAASLAIGEMVRTNLVTGLARAKALLEGHADVD